MNIKLVMRKHRVVQSLMKIYRERYRDVSAEIIDREKHYEVVINCPNMRSESIREIAMIDGHLRIHMGYALIMYKYDDAGIIVPLYAYNIYLPIPEDAERVIGWRIRNGVVSVRIGKGDEE